ncbi:MAG: hypothetical protein Q9222_001133 [Ikaeria aurantiellina]
MALSTLRHQGKLELIALSTLLPLSVTLTSPHNLLTPLVARQDDPNDGPCEKPPCADANTCFYDYGPLSGEWKCQGGQPNFDYCDVAVDVVCSTLAYDISTSDAEPYFYNVGTGVLEGQGADCFAQARNGKEASANVPYDFCIAAFNTIKGCEIFKGDKYDESCVVGIYSEIFNGLGAGLPVDAKKPLFVLGMTGTFFTDDAPQPGSAP